MKLEQNNIINSLHYFKDEELIKSFQDFGWKLSNDADDIQGLSWNEFDVISILGTELE